MSLQVIATEAVNFAIKHPSKICVVCGTEFIAKSRNQVCCNIWCSQKRQNEIYRKKHGEVKPRLCIICGIQFIPKTNSNASYCSQECKLKERQKLKLPKPLVREYFFERANFACEECGATRTHFECHHIIPIYKGGKDTIKNIAVLCDKCHRKAHGMK